MNCSGSSVPRPRPPESDSPILDAFVMGIVIGILIGGCVVLILINLAGLIC